MSDVQVYDSHPYKQFEGTPEWVSIDRALLELEKNQGPVETIRHELLVGYLCKALAEPAVVAPVQEPVRQKTHAEIKELLRSFREEVQQSHPGRDVLSEFLAERRMEAERE